MKAKAKKRKTVVDFSVLAQRDIEGLMQKKQAAQVPQPAQSMFLQFWKKTERVTLKHVTSRFHSA